MKLLEELIDRRAWLALQQELIDMGFDAKLTATGLDVKADLSTVGLGFVLTGKVKDSMAGRYTLDFGDVYATSISKTKLHDELVGECINKIESMLNSACGSWLSFAKKRELLDAVLSGKKLRSENGEDPGPGWTGFAKTRGTNNYGQEELYLK